MWASIEACSKKDTLFTVGSKNAMRRGFETGLWGYEQTDHNVVGEGGWSANVDTGILIYQGLPPCADELCNVSLGLLSILICILSTPRWRSALSQRCVLEPLAKNALQKK